MTQDNNHPVWGVYDQYRTARLNVKYYSGRLAKLERLNFWIELTLAATASSSAIAAFTLWQTSIGGAIWKILGGVAAVFALLKPLLNLTDKIRKLEEVITGYRLLEHDLKKITMSVHQRKAYDKELSDRFLSALDRMDSLVIKYNESSEDKLLKKRCEDEVLSELPSTHFYVPEGEKP